MKISLLFLTLFIVVKSFSQNHFQQFYPIITSSPDLSKKTEFEINRLSSLSLKNTLTKTEESEFNLLSDKYGEGTESIWSVIDVGCSWYCGGGNYKVYASSNLNSQGGYQYYAKSANDLSYKTAWVEGRDGEGIGEFIEYSFKNKSPRITAIIISNGYMKSVESWKNNNRVKKLKFYIDGKESGILNLEDSRTDQRFELGTFGHNSNGTELVLRFEILEVYKGAKYNDTAITEIYFDGIDVH